MTIDINELRRLAQAALAGPDGISLNWIKLLQDFQQKASPSAISELLDRLEAEESKQAALLDCLNEWKELAKSAEKERDALRAENAALIDDMNLLRNNNMALRAKIEAMEKQVPVAWTTKLALEYGASRLGFQVSGVNMWGENGVPLYALPGAKGE